MKFIPIHTSCDDYKYSFWPRTVYHQNIINMTSLSNFKVATALVLPIIIYFIIIVAKLFITLAARTYLLIFIFAPNIVIY